MQNLKGFADKIMNARFLGSGSSTDKNSNTSVPSSTFHPDDLCVIPLRNSLKYLAVGRA
jgi:hypothetical protein